MGITEKLEAWRQSEDQCMDELDNIMVEVQEMEAKLETARKIVECMQNDSVVKDNETWMLDRLIQALR
jgi:hypothetical protein